MPEPQRLDPEQFVFKLRAFHESPEEHRGDLANQMSDAIVQKRVDLAAVRQFLIDAGQGPLLTTLDALVDLIEPYIEEGGAEE